MTPPILVVLLGAGLASITFLPGALVALFGRGRPDGQASGL